MESKPKTRWNKAYYDPMPSSRLEPGADHDKPLKRAAFDPGRYQRVYTALLEGYRGAKAIRQTLGLSHRQAAESQRQLAKAGYLVKEGVKGREYYAPADAMVKEVKL